VPNYDYECAHCGYKFEAFQKITDKPLNECPKCSKKVKRLIGCGSGIIFKGSGFYATDYRKKAKSDTTKDKCSTCPQAKEGCQIKP
jgi:putative FmdB family regulatory protein